jgi:steroid 5-alpha reductase family enzyme
MNLFLLTLVIIAVSMLSLWLISLVVKDAGIIDIFWGMGFALLTVVSYGLTDGYPPRKQLLTLLVVFWGFRLAFHLAWRRLGEGEDFRYRIMRQKYGSRFSILSLLIVFGLQGVLMWIISLPLQAAQISRTPDQLTPLDWLGVFLWLVGFSFESIGDWQLSRFKSDPKNRRKILDRGLWAYTRHPNYFGDALLWWGYFLIAVATGAWWTVISPIVMTYLLLRVSGVALLEKSMVKTKPGYLNYARRTSAFFPWFPKRETGS